MEKVSPLGNLLHSDFCIYPQFDWEKIFWQKAGTCLGEKSNFKNMTVRTVFANQQFQECFDGKIFWCCLNQGILRFKNAYGKWCSL